MHCSYHKCLTVYYRRVLAGLLHKALRGRRGTYRHFNSFVDEFYAEHGAHRVASVNNHALDLDRLGDFRITRLIRDPRDLVVSGYFYHRRGAEDWCLVEDPSADDWAVVNGNVPPGLLPGESLTSHLQRVDQEDGLIAEMDFRRHHFESMRAWPTDDERIRVFRYEDLVGNEEAVFGEMLAHFGMAWPERLVGRRLARHHRAARTSADRHIRDASAGQWRAVFTPRVSEAFTERFGDLPEVLGYDATDVTQGR